MCFGDIWSSVTLTVIVVSVSVYEYIKGVNYLETKCAACNTAYSLYTTFLRIQIVLLSILGISYTRKFSYFRKSIREMLEKENFSSIRTNKKQISIFFMLFLQLIRIYFDVTLDSLWFFRMINHLSFFLMLRSTMDLVDTLTPIRDMYQDIRDRIRVGSKGENSRRGRKEGKRALRKYLVISTDILNLQECANNAFGMQACLIQFGIHIGSAVNAYLFAYLNLQKWSSTSLNFFLFLDALQYGFIASIFAVIGHSTSDSAKAVIVEIVDFSVKVENFDGFQLVKQLALYNVNEPPNMTAWTFYPLNMESLFYMFSTTAAFVFILLQFNSVYSNFDFAVD